MSKSLGVLFVASEAEPFVKTGSLADLAGTLPKSVKALGHDIRVMIPGYGFINNRRFQIHSLLRMKDVEVPVSGHMEHASIKSSYMDSENQKVQVYFIANDHYFNREGLYYHPETKKYFSDNDERFIFFCRGVLETLKRLGWQPRIIHCNGWQCGLIPAYLKTIYKNDSYFRNIRTVFTAYSLASHGIFPKKSLEKAGFASGLFAKNGSDAEKLDFLRAGLAFADVVTTIGSRTEKGILLSPQNGLEEILKTRKNHVFSMAHVSSSGHCQEVLAQKFVDVYLDLAKNG